jgi:hypothetical protein
MSKKQINIRLDAELYQLAKEKCEQKFEIGLGPFIKMFLRTFVSQKGFGFFIGDGDVFRTYNNWINKKRLEKSWGYNISLLGPYYKDLFKL